PSPLRERRLRGGDAGVRSCLRAQWARCAPLQPLPHGGSDSRCSFGRSVRYLAEGEPDAERRVQLERRLENLRQRQARETTQVEATADDAPRSWSHLPTRAGVTSCPPRSRSPSRAPDWSALRSSAGW